ncbi:MAG: right-handed parallel beta-helix repeat-containing protein [Candidatus Bathyarchaeota archaeon]|nr:right-handed parallel beta-helix repeat-containing protein [Candidatus Bathyarchaeota archaeon]
MKNMLLTGVLMTAVICVFPLFGSVTFAIAQNPISVNGIIRSDTTWTKANSPYNLFGPILVSENVTLTIEPGVVIHLSNGPYIQVNGTLIARGTNTDPIYIDGGSIIFTASSTAWDDDAGTGSIIEKATLSTEIHDASPKINSSHIVITTIHGGSPTIIDNYVGVYISVYDGSPLIANNFFNKSQINVNGGSPVIVNNRIIGVPTIVNGGDSIRGLPYYGINLEGSNITAYIAHNTITRHHVAGINAQDGTITIERNLITNNHFGVEIGQNANVILLNNTIADNEHTGIRAAVPAPSPVILYNNIKNNTLYNMNLGASFDGVGNPVNITASYNWWGTTSQYSINRSIYDFKNDFTLGVVIFVPFLAEPCPQAAPDLNVILPIPVPQVTPSQTASPAHSVAPTHTSTITPNQSVTPSPSPTIPEMNLAAAILVTLVSFVFAVAFKRRYLSR